MGKLHLFLFENYEREKYLKGLSQFLIRKNSYIKSMVRSIRPLNTFKQL